MASFKEISEVFFERTHMSTTLLYQSFGIRGYQQTRIEFIGGVTRFHVQPSEKSICCPSCGSSNVIRRGKKRREFRASPIGLKRTVIVAAAPCAVPRLRSRWPDQGRLCQCTSKLRQGLGQIRIAAKALRAGARAMQVQS